MPQKSVPVSVNLLDIIVDPSRLPSLDEPQQCEVVRQAREAALLGYLDARIDPATTSGKLAEHLESARIQARYYDVRLSWEIDCLGRVLDVLPGPVILLKGAAYRALDLGVAQGRLASDVDLLLPREQLLVAEEILKASGWEAMKEDAYEDHYYREFSHELPPLQNIERGTVVDLHHNILPPTARFKPEAARLLAAAEPIADSPFHALCAVDTLLHRCAHLFADGDLNNCLRELVDIRELLEHYTDDPRFLEDAAQRARELELLLPLYYALYFCVELLAWQLPEGLVARLEQEVGGQTRLTRSLMERLLRPADEGSSDMARTFSGWGLFMRSHWLRMPPWMLARHLARQTWRRGGIKTG